MLNLFGGSAFVKLGQGLGSFPLFGEASEQLLPLCASDALMMQVEVLRSSAEPTKRAPAHA